jgi:hypothetical protein
MISQKPHLGADFESPIFCEIWYYAKNRDSNVGSNARYSVFAIVKSFEVGYLDSFWEQYAVYFEY